MNKKLPIGTIIAVPMKIVDETERSYIAACLDNCITSIYIQKESLCAIPASESFGSCTIISIPEYFANAKVGDKVWAIGDDEDGYIKNIYDNDLMIDYTGYNSIGYDRNGVLYGGDEQTLFYVDDPRVARMKEVIVESELKIKKIIEGD